MLKITKFESEILEVNQETPSVKTIRFSVPEEFEFNPGQFVAFILDTDGKEERRFYSIAKHGKGYIEAAINKVKNGRVSPIIHNWKKEDKVKIHGPLGMFVLKKDAFEKENIFIATGTGVAPFAAMIPKLLSGTDKKVILLAGYKHENEIIYDKFFSDLNKNNKNFEYHAVISRPENPQYKGSIGRVQSLIENHLPHNFAGDVYLCGLYEMIKDVEQMLIQKGIAKERIIFERYD